MKKILIVPLVAALGAGAWYMLRHSSPEASEVASPTAPVTVAPLERKPISAFVTAYGVVQPATSGAHVIVLAYDCIVQRIEIGVGARLGKGALIAQVAPSPDAKLQLDSARDMEALAEKAFAATRERFELRLATNQDLLAADQALLDAKIRLSSYEKRGEAGSGRIVAPVAGIVTNLNAQPGTLVTAGTPLATVSDAADLVANLMIEAGDAGQVRPGQPATLASANRPEARPVTAEVGLVGAMVDLTTGATSVLVPLPPQADWLPGEHVHARIEVRTEVGFVVPRNAVLPEDGKEVLYTIRDDKAVRHLVGVGITNATSAEVFSKDLHSGDPVVVVGNYELEDGMGVQVQKSVSEAEP